MSKQIHKYIVVMRDYNQQFWKGSNTW